MTRPALLAALLLSSCGDKESDTTTGGEGSEDTAVDDSVPGWPSGQNCPDDVPEEYRNIWDCQLNGCESKYQSVTYMLATGESTTDAIEVTEQYFIFYRSKDWCIDEMTILGETATDANPTSLGCESCETAWKYERTITKDECRIAWNWVYNDKNNDSDVFNGYFMFDTHNSFGDRNPDGNTLVYAVHFNQSWSSGDLDNNYARGTAVPTTEVDGPPELYTWKSSGSCK